MDAVDAPRIDGVGIDVDFTELELPFRGAILDAMQKRGSIDEERAELV